MQYIVGYSPNERGADAIILAAALAQTQGAELVIVHVLDGQPPEQTRSREERATQNLRAGNATQWLAEAVSHVSEGVPARTQVTYAESVAEGLLEVARETDAQLVVVSAARFGPLKRFTVGSLANALLHCSHVPVALAPSGYEPRAGVTRMTAAIGSRAGASTLLDVAEASAARQHVPLRLLSLVALDEHETAGAEGALAQAREHATAILDEVVSSIDGRADVVANVVEGTTIEDAVESVTWDDGEIMLIGSSRLAEKHKLFMGTTANKILRVLPIPLVVVPREMVV